MFGLGVGELVVIFLIVFLLFGPKALPEIAKGLGQALKTFKKETKEVSDQIKTNFDSDSPNTQEQKAVDSKLDDSNDSQ
jgi:sec-independent protein translocase protein TatA